MTITRRHAILGSAAGAAALAVSGCGKSNPADEGKTSITYTWWSGPQKDAAIKKCIAAFEKKNPDITIKTIATPWAGYWDKLATMTAGGNPPELIHMSERYILEYGQRGALADLKGFSSIDTSKLDDFIVKLGEPSDGKHVYALPTGLNMVCLSANTTLLKKLGIERPDDSTWTWDDLIALSKQAKAKGVIGCDYFAGVETCRTWVFQHGEQFYNADGTGTGFKPETLKSYLQYQMDLKANGGPTPDQLSEAANTPPEAAPYATGKQALAWVYSNTLETTADVAEGQEYELLRVPSPTGKVTDNGMYMKGSEFYSISAKADKAKQEAAAKFVDYMLNDPEAAKVMGVTEGVPPNPEMAEAAKGSLSETNKHVADFTLEVKDEIQGDSPGPSPVGSGNIQGIFDREFLDLLYGKISIDDAVEKIMKGIDGELKK